MEHAIKEWEDGTLSCRDFKEDHAGERFQNHIAGMQFLIEKCGAYVAWRRTEIFKSML